MSVQVDLRILLLFYTPLPLIEIYHPLREDDGASFMQF